MSVAEVIGLYRFDPAENHRTDLIFGGRYVEIDNDISLGGNSVVSGSVDWVDPIMGGRWIWSFADDWSLIARGDIGGFGAGSDFAWHAIGLVEWAPFTHVTFLAGYKALDMDYEDGSKQSMDYFNFDATIHGPVLGVNFRW